MPEKQDASQLNFSREVEALCGLAGQTIDLLEKQDTMLRQRALHLPQLSLAALRRIAHDLEKLKADLSEEQQELVQLRALATMLTDITTSLNLDTVLNDAMAIVIALSHAERGYIVLKDEAGRVDFRISSDHTSGSSDALADTDEPQISHTILNEVLTSGHPLLADNAYKDEQFRNKQSIARLSLRSVLCVPLVHKGDTLGVVYVDNRLQSGVFTEREKNLLMAFANTAAVAIVNARLYRDLQHLLAEITQVKNFMDNVFTSLGSGVIATDADDRITTFNRAAEKILNLSSADVLGSPLHAILPRMTSDLADYLQHIRQQGERQLIDAEVTVEGRGRIALSARLGPLKDAQQRIQGVTMVLDDVTEQASREQELMVMKHYLPPALVEQIQDIARLALGGERRQVTCLFVRVRTFDLVDGVPPQVMMSLLNTYLTAATDCVHATGGIIDKYMGNEVMALFNTQLNPADDHAARALESALMMREVFTSLYQADGIQPGGHLYHVGIHTGTATLGNVGSLSRRDFTAIGDTVNLAKRLEENAAEGQIIISEAVAAHLGDLRALRLYELDPVQVKGRQQTTRIYEVFRA